MSTRREADAFARALDVLDHGALPDSAAEQATEVASLVTLARALPRPDLTMEPASRQRMRRRLVAMAAVAQPEQSTAEWPPATYRHAPFWSAPYRRSAVAASVVTLLLLAVVGLRAGAEKALPGDLLYRVKTASESARLATTSGKIARGERHLAFASERLQEVDELLQRQHAGAAALAGAAPRHGQPVAAGESTNARTPTPVWNALGAMADHTVAGTKDLTEAWQATGDSRPLTILKTFTREKFPRLATTISTLPVVDRRAAARSLNLLVLVSGRAEELERVSKRCDAQCRAGTSPGGRGLAISTDPLGAVPCTNTCAKADSVTELALPTSALGTESAALATALTTMLSGLPPAGDSAPTPTPLLSLPAVPPAPSSSAPPGTATPTPTTPVTATPPGTGGPAQTSQPPAGSPTASTPVAPPSSTPTPTPTPTPTTTPTPTPPPTPPPTDSPSAFDDPSAGITTSSSPASANSDSSGGPLLPGPAPSASTPGPSDGAANPASGTAAR